MGSTTSLPIINRGTPDNACPKRTPVADKHRGQTQTQQAPDGQPGASLSRSKSCSNANVARHADSAGPAYHKVSNGNYSQEPPAASSTAAAAPATAAPVSTVLPEKGGLIGLSNLGNTCYMNSILQCLSHTRQLVDFALEKGADTNRAASAGGGGGGSLCRAFCSLLQRMWDPVRSGAVSPSELKQCVAQYAPRFRGFSQQDSEEFLRYLLEGLHEDLNKVDVRPKLPPIDYENLDKLSDAEKAEELWQRYLQLDNSTIVDAFVGQLKSTLECSHCSHKSVTFDPFWDLALPIPSKSRTTLEACLRLFTAQETLDGNERPTCEHCRCRRKCAKRFSLFRLPGVLVIHLMRFSGERFKTKLNTLVEYPLELDVREFVDKKCLLGQTPLYQLYAVSEHSGTPYGGHYTAVVRHAGNGRWLRYNDSRVDDAHEKSIVSTEGYVLFYAMVRSPAASRSPDVREA